MRQKLLCILISLLTATMAWAASGNYGTWAVSAPANAMVISIVRTHTGLGLKDAKTLLQSNTPFYVLQNVTLGEAKAVALELNDAGATARW